MKTRDWGKRSLIHKLTYTDAIACNWSLQQMILLLCEYTFSRMLCLIPRREDRCQLTLNRFRTVRRKFSRS